MAEGNTTSSLPSERFHSLDALRATMMLLGLVLHASYGHCTFTPNNLWPFRADGQSRGFDVLFLWLHAFRMPVFFTVAGFFVALLHERRGLGKMLRNRFDRIAKPFLLFWVLLHPPILIAFMYASHAGAPAPWSQVVALLRSGKALTQPPLSMVELPNLFHLWFLYLLCFYCLGYAALAKLRGGAALAALQARLMSPGTRWVWIAACAAVGSLARWGFLGASIGLIPRPEIFFSYFFHFLFGAMLWHRRELMAVWQKRAVYYLLVSLVFFVGLLIVLKTRSVRDYSTKLMLSTLYTLIAWFTTWGLIGAFHALFNRPRPVVRYVTDSSYFVYLTEVPLVVVTAGLLYGSGLPMLVQFAINCLSVFFLLLIVYQVAVRRTFIGAFLNGRRY